MICRRCPDPIEDGRIYCRRCLKSKKCYVCGLIMPIGRKLVHPGCKEFASPRKRKKPKPEPVDYGTLPPPEMDETDEVDALPVPVVRICD